MLDSVFSAFFRKGQVLETFRGKGIYQTAVDKAIENLNQGEWVCQQGTNFFTAKAICTQIHLFGEGKVHQPGWYPPVPIPPEGSSHVPDQNQILKSQQHDSEPPLLLRFKWGVYVRPSPSFYI